MAVKISDLTYWLVSVLKYTYGLADVIFPWSYHFVWIINKYVLTNEIKRGWEQSKEETEHNFYILESYGNFPSEKDAVEVWRQSVD
jgi:hypothetical protein